MILRFGGIRFIQFSKKDDRDRFTGSVCGTSRIDFESSLGPSERFAGLKNDKRRDICENRHVPEQEKRPK